ncbi:RHS repeat protein [Pseudomonas nitroreducens]|uniref:RHS repeat protein n=1 Tax=Pseudomonas nitroreducens TaxID=46680 RepID=UPI0026595BC8|nr:RHS repeat protein [Pseudomonas nitroreducens]MCP1646654.1 hypothetical protein [Pseudomonas nitroreducens]MCP1685230.1 hypothetical protein [Pseudomonas nitroreducens]
MNTRIAFFLLLAIAPLFSRAEPIFPTIIIGYTSTPTNYIYATGDAACEAVRPKTPVNDYVYTNARFNEIPGYGAGCVYRTENIRYGWINENHFFQNWAYREFGCASGYDKYFDFPANSYMCRLREDQSRIIEGPQCTEPGTPDPATGNFNFVVEALPGTTTGPVVQYSASTRTWRSPVSTSLEVTPAASTARVHLPDGTRAIFTLNGNSATSYAAGTGVLTKAGDQWSYISPSNERFTFDSTGSVSQWITGDGKENFDFTRTTGEVNITSSKGINVNYTINSTGQPTSVNSGSNSYIMTYDASGRLTKLSLVSNEGQTAKTFLYEIETQPNYLTGVLDENNVRIASWTYDSNGRATSRDSAGNVVATNTYGTDGTTTTTNSYGKPTKYKFSVIRNAKYVTAIEGQPSANCPASNSSFTYDTQGLLKTKTDAKGNLTTYDYNDRGLETSRIEASGTPQARTITTEWHPSLYLKTKVTEPDRITTYQYDAQGRQTGQTVTPR